MRRILLSLLSSMLVTTLYARPVEIPLWHSFSGHLGEVFNRLCDEFNHSQSRYLVKTIYKGNYTESLTGFAAAFRAHKPPAMIQVFEVGTATMMYPAGIIKPLYQLLTETSTDINTDDFLPAIRGYYSDDNNRLVALPFNSSVPVLYYNKTLFLQAGLSDNDVPKTWLEMDAVAKKLKQHGIACAYTTTYPSWIHLESYAMIHGMAFNSKEPNVLTKRVKLAQPALINHIKRMVKWQQEDLFQYGGRNDDSSSLFNSGHCAMMTQSSGAYKSLHDMVPFELGISQLPYDNTVTTQRYNSVIGGGALWAVAGFDDSTYRGIAQFAKFVSKPDVQARWQRETGYLPVSNQALIINQQSKQFDKNLLIAYQEVNHQKKSPKIRLGAYSQIRIINDEELEAAFAGTKTVEQALNDAQTRVNHLLKRFEKNVS